MNLIFPAIMILFLVAIVFAIVSGFYNAVYYPIRQKFKRKNEHGYVLNLYGKYEHREIVEKLIKRELRVGEEVHHINGVKWDNRKRNLALMTRDEHIRWHKKLEWMWSKRMRPSLRWQRDNLKKDFGAILF